jgi:hypothetical protein
LLLEELESTLATGFKQACDSNAPIDGTRLKEKALHIPTHLGIANIFASSGRTKRINRRRHKTVYRTLWGRSWSVHPETVKA